MKLGDLLADSVEGAALPPAVSSLEVTGLDYDSRRIQPGWIFFAFQGAKTDGASFAADAVSRGAVAVISELPSPAGFPAPWITVAHGRQTLALAVRRFYPAATNIRLTGITGTNGKTTTSYLIDSIFRSAGYTTALVGTIEYHVAGEVRPAINTTPDSLDLYRLLDELAARQGTHATMEVSSHALQLGRVWGVHFQAAVFTNLTQDHLDFHGSMEAYFEAKTKLFEGQGAKPPQQAIINFDDSWGRRIRVSNGTQAWWYGLSAGASVRAAKIEDSFHGLRFEIHHDHGMLRIQSALVGRINVYNILAAASTGLSFGLKEDVISEGIAQCIAVPGRFERIDEGQPFLVVVDYAHTDDALRNTIAVARGLNPSRVITLFGCGGDRDRTKRPRMGEVAAQYSDYVVLTSDNPRSEDPLAIMNDAMVGIRRHDTPHFAEPDRAKAIRHAIQYAEPGDVVILAGKGHETYQILGSRTIHFDDREVAREVLRGVRI
jgi:UDP-N-acetylmuramoyl-L-alanyl-D-glutamate--2,6-diaminopimelate ligase